MKSQNTAYQIKTLFLAIIATLLTIISCHKHNEFSKQDLETQQAFIDLIDLTYNQLDEEMVKDSVRTLILIPEEK